MKQLSLLTVIVGSILLQYSQAQLLEDKFIKVQEIPKKAKHHTYGPFRFYIPEGWRVRKLITGKGVRAEGPLSYMYGAKPMKFGLSASEIPIGKMPLEAFMQDMADTIKKKAEYMKAAFNSSETKKQGEKLGADVDLEAFADMSQEKLVINGKKVVRTQAKSLISLNGHQTYTITHMLWYKQGDNIYSFGGTYLVQDKARFEKFTQWMLNRLTIE